LTSVTGVLYETTNNGWKRITSLQSNLSLTDASDASYTMDKDTMQMTPSLSSATPSYTPFSVGNRTFQFVTSEELTIVKSNDGTIITLVAPKNIDYHLDFSDTYSKEILLNGANKNAGDIINIQYGGKGDLLIPYAQNSNNYNKPAFTFKDGTVLSVDGKSYVTQALSGVREIQESSGNTTACNSLNLNDIDSLTLPTGTTNSFNKDAMPTPAEFPATISFINGVRVNNSN
jgi:hypothetical protein